MSVYDASRYGTLHDAQYDCWGRRLATASSDGVVRIWPSAAEGGQVLCESELRGHTGPVWQVCWAAGRFASTLASCATGSDSHVIVWREARSGDWQAVHRLSNVGVAVAIAFAPPEHGLLLAAATERGEVTMLTRREVSTSPVLPSGEQWLTKAFQAHDCCVTAVSWAPAASPATLAAGPAAARAAPKGPRRLVTGGSDATVRVWRFDEKTDAWTKHQDLPGGHHGGPIRDVAWRPNIGIPSSAIASCAEDGSIVVWTQDMAESDWWPQAVWVADGDARRLSWSKAGTLLAVSVGDSGSALYKEGPTGQWSTLTSMDDD